jgi:predicted transcriptional regulator
MSTKKLVLETVRDLPDDATWSEIEERIRFLAAIETSRQEVRAGKLVPHADVSDLLCSWTTQ